MVTEIDLALSDGRTLHVYDTGAGDGAARLAVFWVPQPISRHGPLPVASSAQRTIDAERMLGQAARLC